MSDQLRFGDRLPSLRKMSDIYRVGIGTVLNAYLQLEKERFIQSKPQSGFYVSYKNTFTNDIGIMWSPLCKPIVLAIYTVQNKPDAKIRDDIVASTTSIVMDEFAKNDASFKALFS